MKGQMTIVISKSNGIKQCFEVPATTIRCDEKTCDFHGDKVTALIRYHCSLLPAFFLEGKASFQGKVWYSRDAVFSHSNSGTGTKEIKGSGLQMVISTIETELLNIITKQRLLQAEQQTSIDEDSSLGYVLFPCIISLRSQSEGGILFPLYRWGNWGLGVLENLSRIKANE